MIDGTSCQLDAEKQEASLLFHDQDFLSSGGWASFHCQVEDKNILWMETMIWLFSGLNEHILDHARQPGQRRQSGHKGWCPSCRHLPPLGQVPRQEHLLPPSPAPPPTNRHQQGRVWHLWPSLKSRKRWSFCPSNLFAWCHKVWNLSTKFVLRLSLSTNLVPRIIVLSTKLLPGTCSK